MAFVVAAELFPTRYRSTAYGVSAAFGRLSYILNYLIIGIYGAYMSFEISDTRIFIISVVSAVFMVIGAVSTTLLPETKNEPLEKIAEDDELNA